MIYPPFLKKGQTIGIVAPSAGSPDGLLRYNLAKKRWQDAGYSFVESEDIFNFKDFVSAPDFKRAEEFMKMWENEDVNSIISIAGGEFMTLILPHLNPERLMAAKPKLFQGFSDNTVINHILLTWLDTASVSHYNIKYYGQKRLHESLKDSMAFLQGKKLSFTSFKKFEKERFKEPKNEFYGFNLKHKVKWVNGRDEKSIKIAGRAVGGCMDVLMHFLGTPYDKTKDFLEKYKEDGFIWFLESYDLSVLELKRVLWQFKESGWFKYAKGIVFGRPNVDAPILDLTYEKVAMEVLSPLDIPVVFGADFGHKPPTFPLLLGSIATVESSGGKGKISFELK